MQAHREMVLVVDTNRDSSYVYDVLFNSLNETKDGGKKLAAIKLNQCV